MADARAVFATCDTAPRTIDGGVDVALLLDQRDSAGRSDVREIVCAPAATVDTRDAGRAHRYLYVIDGAWQVVLGDERHAAGPGTMIQAPAGCPCTARVTGMRPGRLLLVTLPPRASAT